MAMSIGVLIVCQQRVYVFYIRNVHTNKIAACWPARICLATHALAPINIWKLIINVSPVSILLLSLRLLVFFFCVCFCSFLLLSCTVFFHSIQLSQCLSFDMNRRIPLIRLCASIQFIRSLCGWMRPTRTNNMQFHSLSIRLRCWRKAVQTVIMHASYLYIMCMGYVRTVYMYVCVPLIRRVFCSGCTVTFWETPAHFTNSQSFRFRCPFADEATTKSGSNWIREVPWKWKRKRKKNNIDMYMPERHRRLCSTFIRFVSSAFWDK